jgi:hypothetical protein
MNELLLGLLVWIGDNTPYLAELPAPQVTLVSESELCQAYGVERLADCRVLGLRAFYDKQGTIFLREGFDPDDPVDQSRLLHELIHHVQWDNGANEYRCLGHLEHEAYTLQDTWLIEQSLSPRSDPFRLALFAASCDA